MYDDVDYRFNWGKLIIKVVIFAILILLAVIVISKTINKSKDDYMEKNIELFKESVIDYFDQNKLPEETGDKVKVTLKELKEDNILKDLTDGKGKSCDATKSYAEVKKLAEDYEVTLTLNCGEQKKIVKSTIKKDDICDCASCCVEEEEEEQETTEEQSSTPSVPTVTPTVQPAKQTYYQYIKVEKVYSDWQLERMSGDNVEKTQKQILLSDYCLLKDMKYYSTGYVSTVREPYTYTIKLLDIPYNTNYIRVLGTEHFDNDLSMYRAYLNQKSISWVTDIKNPEGVIVPDAYTYRRTSLKSNNFSFSVEQPYRCDNSYCVDITIKVKNLYNVEAYYAENLDEYVHFVPIHFYGVYADMNSCIIDTNANAAEYADYKIVDTYYDYRTVYRSYTYEKDYDNMIWSTKTSIDGYVKTGKTDLR